MTRVYKKSDTAPQDINCNSSSVNMKAHFDEPFDAACVSSIPTPSQEYHRRVSEKSLMQLLKSIQRRTSGNMCFGRLRNGNASECTGILPEYYWADCSQLWNRLPGQGIAITLYIEPSGCLGEVTQFVLGILERNMRDFQVLASALER